MRPTPLSLTGARWETGSTTPEQVQQICERSGLSEVAARVLAQRWDAGAPPALAWEAPQLEDLHDPLQMHNMSAAIDRLSHALRDGQKLRIITDYDVDGTTSSLILQATLRILSSNADISYHIPNRFDEGYGFSVRAAREAASDGVGLIITADIGVRDHAAVEAANEAGVDVLICDHHLPAGASVPHGAIVLCPPQRDCDYPNPSLAA